VFDIALTRGELDAWVRDLEVVATALEDQQISSFLASPKVAFPRKQEVLATILEGVNPLVQNLMYMLVSKGRLSILPDLEAEYRRLVDAHRGVEEVEVTTAILLDDQQRDEISDHLSRTIAKDIRLLTKVDPDIVGGVVYRVGDKVLDGSVRSKLLALKRNLAQVSR
jgi:F-type H+-transporting ATPase subunit delta